MKLKPIVISTMLASSSLGFTAQSHAADCVGNQCRDVMLERVYVRHGGDVSVSTSGEELNLNCSAENQIYLTLSNDHPNEDEIYAMILARKLENRPIWIRVTGESGEPCAVAYTVLR